MASEIEASKIESFLAGPLVTWLKSCGEDKDHEITYDELVDGPLIGNIFMQIEPHPTLDSIVPSNNDMKIRLQNLQTIYVNLKRVYEDTLGQLVVQMPNALTLAREPRVNLAELDLLLQLLLGCAVQCENKGFFITRIQQLSADEQKHIAECIKKVIEVPELVLSLEMFSVENSNPQFSYIPMISRKVFSKMSQIHRERNEYLYKLNKLGNIEQILYTPNKLEQDEVAAQLETQIADLKSEVKAQSQALKNNAELLDDQRKTIQEYESALAASRKENERLTLELREAQSYRDKVEAANEATEKLTDLEKKYAELKSQLIDFDFYKTRVEELNESQCILEQSKEELEEKVDCYELKVRRIDELERQVCLLKEEVTALKLQKSEIQRRLEEVYLEYNKLGSALQNPCKPDLEASFECDEDESDALFSSTRMQASICEELNQTSQAQIAQLERENQRLKVLLDTAKKSATTMDEAKPRIRELEAENEALKIEVASLEDDVHRLRRNNFTIECQLQSFFKIQELEMQDLQKSEGDSDKVEALLRKESEMLKEKEVLQALLDSTQQHLARVEKELRCAEKQLFAKSEESANLCAKLIELRKELQLAQLQPLAEKEKKNYANKDIVREKRKSSEDVAREQRKSSELVVDHCSNCKNELRRSQNLMQILRSVTCHNHELSKQIRGEREEAQRSLMKVEQQLYDQCRQGELLQMKIISLMEPVKRRSSRLKLMKKNLGDLRRKSCEFFRRSSRSQDGEGELTRRELDAGEQMFEQSIQEVEIDWNRPDVLPGAEDKLPELKEME